MEIKQKLLPPTMPDFLKLEQPLGKRQEGFSVARGFPIQNLTEEEAIEFGELMKNEFIKHWRFRKSNPNKEQESLYGYR